MIETLALSRRENNPDNSYPHDVAGIAMCFREVTDEAEQKRLLTRLQHNM